MKNLSITIFRRKKQKCSNLEIPGEGPVYSQRLGYMMKRAYCSLKYQMRHTVIDDLWNFLFTSEILPNYLPLGAPALPVNEVNSENIYKSLLILTFQTSIKAQFHMVA